MAGELVEMQVESVRVHMLSNRHVVILKQLDRDRFLPIWIGHWEASSIAMKLQGLTPERPMTYDLFAATLQGLGVQLSRVVITDLAEETFHATITIERDGRPLDVDARPSDALALAVRTGARIFATAAVIERAALGPEGAQSATTAEGPPIESIDEGVVDPRLDMFRDFINSLDAPTEGEGRSS